MIVVRLMGGMGNQMFQYAAARALAHRLGTDLRYDLGYMGCAESGTVRHFELHHLRCAGRPLTVREDLRFGSQYRASIPRRVIARVMRAAQPSSFYEEPRLAFDPAFHALRDDTIIVGRFQSYLYFDEVSDLVRDDFRLAYRTSAMCRAICEEARTGNSVGLHVRRTDYVNDDAYRHVIQALPLDYYARALVSVRDALGADVRIYVVSDDIAWCREQDLFRDAHRFVNLSGAEHPHLEEFEVLRNCRNFVISNSTFAWWAAWLSESPDKLIFAPKQWSHNEEINGADRIPDNWITT